jgi:phosphoribosylaminoimidazole-succinocarboxamide synthase
MAITLTRSDKEEPMRDMTFVHKGSTKDVFRWNDDYVFRFSDRYSVFDWGEMPDHIPCKGFALAGFTKVVYKRLEEKGIKTHLLDKDCGGDEIVVRPFEVIRAAGPLPRKGNVFIPLEVIFRTGVAKGSSLLKRFSHYHEGQRFNQPQIEFTTKLERFDRPLTHEEAKELAGMNDTEWTALLETTTMIALELEALFAQTGITLWDGKVEFAFDQDRNIVLVDSIGPDELRLTKDDVQLSKEVIRQYYRNSEWYKKLDGVKREHGENFKNHIAQPDKLPIGLLKAVENMYLLMPDLIQGSTGARERLEELLVTLKKVSE